MWEILVILVLGKENPGATKATEEFSCSISSPAFYDTKGFRSDAFLKLICVNISLLIQAEQKPSNLLRSIHQEPYLPMSQFGSWLLLLGASRHQLPIFPLCAAPQHSPQPPCGHRLPATSVMASVLLHALQPATSILLVHLSQPMVCIPPTHAHSLGYGQSPGQSRAH